MCKWKAMIIPMLAISLCAGCGSNAAEPAQQETSVNHEDTQMSETHISETQEAEVPPAEISVSIEAEADTSSDTVTAEETPQISEKKSDEYILPDSDTRRLTETDLAGMSAKDLRIARNEIFARHGRKFADEGLKNHFASCSWYKPQYDAAEFDSKSDKILSSTEVYNVQFIKAHEDGTSTSSPGRFTNSFEDTYKEISKYGFRTYEGYDQVSNLAFDFDFTDIDDCGDYLEVNATLMKAIPAPKNLKIGESTEITLNYLTGQTATITQYAEGEYTCSNGEEYYAEDTFYGRVLMITNASDDLEWAVFYEGAMRINKNIPFGYFGDPKKLTISNCNSEGGWYNGVSFDKHGHVKSMIYYGD